MSTAILVLQRQTASFLPQWRQRAGLVITLAGLLLLVAQATGGSADGAGFGLPLY